MFIFHSEIGMSHNFEQRARSQRFSCSNIGREASCRPQSPERNQPVHHTSAPGDLSGHGNNDETHRTGKDVSVPK